MTSFFSGEYGASDGATLRSISGNLVGGLFGSDRIPICSGTTCYIVGRIEVAEPASTALLGIGLFDLVLICSTS